VVASHLSSRVGKRARFSIEGEMTEIDRSLMRALAEPLNQLVRNAIVHGIESPDERRAVGKAEMGAVWIHAYYAGAEVVIEVGDDGRGVNSHALVARAISEGMLDVERARSLSEDAALNLMFQLGVSTLDRSNALAGSGIGLDEVATLIRGLKGDITVASSSSKGTVFRIRVPMTLTVLPTLEITAGGQVFTAPFSLVAASLTNIDGRLRKLPHEGGEQAALGNRPSAWMLTLPADSALFAPKGAALGDSLHAEAEVPAYSLAECLGLRSLESGASPGAAVVIERRGQRVAFLVDAIGAMRETMVRPLPSYLKRQVIRGVTIRSEDGAMALLIDAGELVEQRLLGAAAPPYRAPLRLSSPQPVARVLIVDDSLTIRRTLDQILTAAGFSTALACDGYEALEMMEAELPRVVILDVEMPRLNGYELLAVMRSSQKYHQTRVAMLTSRAGVKHEQYARELGADEYLVKPCPQDTLISVIRRLLMDSERS
jgi:chemosensory pili system protein ChpA (sensor histidine kinase/response regulator)